MNIDAPAGAATDGVDIVEVGEVIAAIELCVRVRLRRRLAQREALRDLAPDTGFVIFPANGSRNTPVNGKLR